MDADQCGDWNTFGSTLLGSCRNPRALRRLLGYARTDDVDVMAVIFKWTGEEKVETQTLRCFYHCIGCDAIAQQQSYVCLYSRAGIA
mmetsp:Transcript_31851/g.59362  ORF Transcript_31851/g.59362 Transcript_31851/m.59362 type:complete len:87 (-) Transcript_31851:68-328(-)